jgi:hypothetical protein
MHGARRLARDYIAEAILRIPPGRIRVLDVACGDGWVNEEFPGTHYVGWDKKNGEDLVKMDCEVFDGWVEHGQSPDLILSVYGICTLLGEEARVWTLLRRIAKPETKFVYVGRYMMVTGREMGRQDPINGYNEEGLRGLATASGWRVVDFKRFLYDGDSYAECTREHLTNGNPNAFAATMEPIQ